MADATGRAGASGELEQKVDTVAEATEDSDDLASVQSVCCFSSTWSLVVSVSPAPPPQVFKVKQTELEGRILARHERVKREAAALEELRRQLEQAAGPERETVEGLRSLLEQASADVERARADYATARTEVSGRA